jgi:hypothetical protein
MLSTSGTETGVSQHSSFYPVSIIPQIFHNRIINQKRYVSLVTDIIIYHAQIIVSLSILELSNFMKIEKL